MRLVLVGQKWFGCEVLALARRLGYDVAAVCAPPGDRLATEARRSGFPLWLPGALRSAELPADADLAVAAHAHVHVPTAFRRALRFGCIGYHPSLLPRHRGRDAVRWAIHVGDAVAGGTVYLLAERADAGPVLAQDWCFIRRGDTPRTLWRRDLGPMGLRLLATVLQDPAGHIARALPQIESLATWEPAFDRSALAGRSRSVSLRHQVRPCRDGLDLDAAAAAALS